MERLLIHGCYDSDTLATLKGLGEKFLGFDLRGRSPNLIPFKKLEELLLDFKGEEVVLMFEDDKATTVLSFLDLLKESESKLILEFRDSRETQYYAAVNSPFIWLFDPEAKWKEILLLENLRAVLLPVHLKSTYQSMPELWSIIEGRQLEVYLHVDNYADAAELLARPEVKVSIDLNQELENAFRRVDQERLKKLKIWRRSHESPAI